MEKVKNTKNEKTAIECMQANEAFNLKTKEGYLFYVGGILSKLVENAQYLCINGKWVQI